MSIIYVEGHKDFIKREKTTEFIIIFKADWSLPSKAMTIIIEDSASKNKDFTYFVLDIGKYDFLYELKTYGVFALPTVIKVKGEDKSGNIIGATTRLQFSISTGLN